MDKVNATVVPAEELDGASCEQATENVDTVEERATAVPENVQIWDQALYFDVTDTEDEPVIRQAVPCWEIFDVFRRRCVPEYRRAKVWDLWTDTLAQSQALNNNHNEMMYGTLLFDRPAFHFRHIIK